jgi:hypothetical protein
MKHAFFDDVAIGLLNMGLEMENIRRQLGRGFEMEAY